MDPEALIPHSGPMCWLDRVLESDDRRTRCALVVREQTPLAGASKARAAGRVPAHAALEYMAQAAAVHAALRVRAGGEGDGGGESSVPHRVALLGTRSLELSRAWLAPGEQLIAEASPAATGAGGLAVFATSVSDSEGREVARARLNLYSEASGA